MLTAHQRRAAWDIVGEDYPGDLGTPEWVAVQQAERDEDRRVAEYKARRDDDAALEAARKTVAEFDKIQTLVKLGKGLSRWGQEFAGSVADQYQRRGSLSAKQWTWVDKLIAEATAPKPEPKDAPVVASVANVYAMFERAAAKLKYPKIILYTEAGDRVQLYRSGPRAKFPGTITVTDGGSYGSSRYYGRIHKDGRWERPDRTPQAVVELVEQFATDPAGIARVHGSRYGNCCFCRKELTTNESLHVGYGPVCAGNYGLPWGDTGDETADDRQAALINEMEEAGREAS